MLSEEEFKEIYYAILNLIENDFLSIDELVDRLDYKDDKILEVIQHLKDNEEVDCQSGNRIKYIPI